MQLEAKNHAGVSGLYIALKKGHANCIETFFELVQYSNLNTRVKRILLAPQGPLNDTPGLCLAMRNGYVNFVDAYCEWILSNNFDHLKEKQLMAIDPNSKSFFGAEVPALHSAMLQDQSECVTVFCQRVLASDLSVQIKENLIIARSSCCPWMPCLVRAILKDKSLSVEAFCQTVLQAKLDVSMKHRLLASKCYGEKIIQYFNSRFNRQTTALRTYRRVIKNSNLDFGTKVSLTSNNINWLKSNLNPARLLHGS